MYDSPFPGEKTTPWTTIRTGSVILSADRTEVLGCWAKSMDIKGYVINIAQMPEPVFDYRAHLADEPMMSSTVRRLQFTLVTDLMPAMQVWIADPETSKADLEADRFYFSTNK